MNEMIDLYIEEGKSAMDKSIQHLRDELIKIRTGKASPTMLNGIMVEYYGTPTPLTQVANLSTPDSRTISIQPWEKKILSNIEQALFAANLGITPMNDGEYIRITIPPLTEERRKEFVKQAKAAGEDAKVGLRSARHKMIDGIKKEVKDGFPEDQGKRCEADVEAIVKEFSTKIADLIQQKETDIMTI